MTHTPERQALRDAFRAVLNDAAAPAQTRRAADAGADPGAALWSQMSELGWIALPIVEAHGGLGLGRAEMALLYEELGRCVAPAPVLGAFLAAEALSSADAQMQARWLPRVAKGEVRIAVAADFAPAIAENGGRLTGGVPHVLDLGAAHAALVPLASRGDSARLALVDLASPGVSVTAAPAVDLTRALDTLVLADAQADIVELTPHRWAALHDHAHIALACDSLGGAEIILARTVEYMKTREQFDRPIGAFQALKHRAAQWKVLLEATRALVHAAVAKWDAGDPESAAAASAAKYYACDAYAAIAGDAVQLHGGIGFTWEHDCHLYLKRAKLNEALFGASATHKDRIAALRFAPVEGGRTA